MSRADSPEEAARLVEGRALPESEREKGDPFASGLTDRQRAARLEGRKVVRNILWGNTEHETLFRVDCFRRYLPNNGLHGIVQFYGLRATRKRKLGEKWSKWDTEPATKMHTVERGPGFSVRK